MFWCCLFANYLWSVETEPKLKSCVSVHNWLKTFFSGFGTIEQTLQLSSWYFFLSDDCCCFSLLCPIYFTLWLAWRHERVFLAPSWTWYFPCALVTGQKSVIVLHSSFHVQILQRNDTTAESSHTGRCHHLHDLRQLHALLQWNLENVMQSIIPPLCCWVSSTSFSSLRCSRVCMWSVWAQRFQGLAERLVEMKQKEVKMGLLWLDSANRKGVDVPTQY